jgi:hypothetical protein
MKRWFRFLQLFFSIVWRWHDTGRIRIVTAVQVAWIMHLRRYKP